MNLKLLLISIININSFVFSMQQQRSLMNNSSQAAVDNGNYDHHRVYQPSGQYGFAQRLLEDNFKEVDNLKVQVQQLNSINVKLETELKCKSENLEIASQELQEERALLIEKIEAHTAQVRDIEKNHKDEIIELHRIHTRQVIATFVVTAVGATGITWLLHKFKIIN